jgi:hypothetical protein
MQHRKNERFTKVIKAALGSNVYDILKEEKAFLAGGAIASLFCNREINDYDIYCPSKYAVARIMCDAIEDNNVLSPYELMVNACTGKSIMCNKGETAIQFITFDYFKNVEDLFNTFDFTVCMGAYSFDTEEFLLHDNFLVHNSQRFLKYNQKTAYPLVSALRVQKYIDKGYNISKLEMMRILATVSEIKLTSWKDAEEHLGGMYAQSITALEEAKGDYSIDALLEALGKEEYREDILLPLKASVSLESILCHLKISGIDQIYVKRVNGNNESTHSPILKKIKYVEGETIDGGENGIYCKPLSKISNLTSAYHGVNLVILEPVAHCCAYNGEALIGKVFVKKIIPWESEEAKTLRKWDMFEALKMVEENDAKL